MREEQDNGFGGTIIVYSNKVIEKWDEEKKLYVHSHVERHVVREWPINSTFRDGYENQAQRASLGQFVRLKKQWHSEITDMIQDAHPELFVHPMSRWDDRRKERIYFRYETSIPKLGYDYVIR